MSGLESLASVVPAQCLWGNLQKLSPLNVSKQAVMSFCVAGVALCDMPTCFMTCQESFCVARATRNTFAAFSEGALHFSWHAQHFGDLPCHFVWQAQHFRRVVLRIFRESQCQGCVTW